MQQFALFALLKIAVADGEVFAVDGVALLTSADRIPVMIAWTIPFSYLLAGVRRRTGSVLAPALLHGAFNGTAGLFTVLVAGGDVLVALPVGLLMALVLAGAALVEARLPRTQRSLPA